jgi:hypothetical protein
MINRNKQCRIAQRPNLLNQGHQLRYRLKVSRDQNNAAHQWVHQYVTILRQQRSPSHIHH